MNWKKVKNVLIIIFLIINGILGYMNYQRKVQAFTLTSHQENNIKRLLYSNNIMLYTLLPQKYPSMKKLILEPKSVSGEEEKKILKLIFGDVEDITVYLESISKNRMQTVYSKGARKLSFSEGRIVYEEDINSKPKTIGSKEESKNLADKFLKSLGYQLSELEWDFKDEGNGQYKYLYYEVYKGNLIYDSYIEFVIKPQGIEKVDIYRMKPVRYIELSRSIYAPDEILFGFMNQVKRETNPGDIIIIQKVDIGYLISPKGEGVKEEEAIPHYRITLADGRYYHINAYNNEIFLN
ncbi:MAG: hypothetical protein GX308_08535 [Epulopiscium sp.]|nr:hypothetical protein [Candidatus Epulonipiscium sp.]